MKIRRRFINEIAGEVRPQKVLSAAIALKKALGPKSEIRDWNYNKITKLIRISPNTFKKLLPELVNAGFVKFRGKNNRILVVCKLYSSTADRNVSIDFFDFGKKGTVSYKEVYRSLRAFLAMYLQHKKNFIKRTIQSCKRPKGLSEFKAARRKVKRLMNGGVLKSMQDAYKEWGISYKKIAEQTGNCVRTAQGIVKYAIAHRWMKKKVRVVRKFIPYVDYAPVKGYSFTTAHFGYILKANTYKLAPKVEIAFGCSRRDASQSAGYKLGGKK